MLVVWRFWSRRDERGFVGGGFYAGLWGLLLRRMEEWLGWAALCAFTLMTLFTLPLPPHHSRVKQRGLRGLECNIVFVFFTSSRSQWYPKNLSHMVQVLWCVCVRPKMMRRVLCVLV